MIDFKKIKAFIFDVDGVILSTDKEHFQAWEKIFEKENIKIDDDDKHIVKGINRSESLRILLNKYNLNVNEEKFNRMLEEKNRIYVNLLEGKNEENQFPYLKELLILLQEKNIKIGIASSSRNAKHLLEKIGVIDYFDNIVDVNKIVKHKPDPEIFITAADNMSVSCGESVVIEDSNAGIKGANEAGIKTIAFNLDNGITEKADLIVNSHKEIIELLK